MKKLDFWKADWFLGVVATLVLLLASGGDLMQSLERKAYDYGVKAASRIPSDKIAVIAIDDQSIANIGRWPWSREVHAKMVDLLAKARAKTIGYTVFFFEPQVDPGFAYIQKLSSVFQGSKFGAAEDPESKEFSRLLSEAEQGLNTDRKLASSAKAAGSVLLPMVFQALVEPQGNPDKPLPDFVARNAVPGISDRNVETDLLPLPAINPLYPIADLSNSVIAVGHLNADPDVDGGVRTEPMVVRYYDKYFPSLSVMLAAKSLNLNVDNIKIKLGEDVTVGKLRIKTDAQLRMHSFFYSDKDNRPAFAIDSFYDVFQGKIPADKYKDKIVLIGATAAGIGQSQVTPISPAMAPVVTLAHSVSSILKEDFFVKPSWGGYVKLAVFLLIAAYLIALLPRLKAGLGAGITAGLLALLVVVHFVLMTQQLMWIQLMGAATLLVVGHLLLTTKRFLVTERSKEKGDIESAHTNRMLGLAQQAQGQLDSAFDMFRKLPMEDSVMEVLYNLALDFERKRQFNKAESVYRYMSEYNPKFRDLEQKLGRAKAMSETVILGGTGGHPGGSMALGAGEKPMLGRYQVEKELGKGAMGVVYLGKDPKIGRVVAIKTMALSQEFDADELKDVKERFFREAETAGRLTHPNIVTIYDAGEEHDLAFIAMEFLKGKDLVAQTKPDNLLPLPRVMSIIARGAEALAYAHTQNVVHRDIKPANMMYEMESDTLKLTDFGIARITDSSKTKTGMVLGTPSYMSPEQLAGKKVDGRSDLFSLGVTLYQMCCGALPFTGDSMAQLMFKIANEPAVDITTRRPDLPECLVAIINKALVKDADQRFQNGDEMAKALRECATVFNSDTVDIGL
jgi:serine/threonine-protein kinase